MNPGAVDIEEALTLIGYGKFHYLLTACCGLCLIASGLQNGMNAFFLPVAQCDLDLTSSEIGSLNASLLIGGICSAFLWGLLADLLGRKKILVFTLLFDWMITMFVSLSQEFASLFVLRYFNGFMIGGPSILTYSYYGEFQPKHLRNKAVCFIGLFFNVFWLILPALAWVIIPLSLEISVMGIWLKSWRLYIIILSLPSLISGLWLLIYLPESPKFLMTRGESKEALIILNKMYTTNTGESKENFKVKLLIDNINKVIKNANDMKIVGRGKCLRLLKDAREQIKQLFQPPLLSITILSSVIFFCNMFGYLGLGLWIPEILKRFEEYNDPNKKLTLCQLQTQEMTFFSSNSTEFKSEDSRCDNHIGVDTTVFRNTFIMGACVLISNIVVSFFAGNFNRKVLPFITMLASSVFAACIYWLNSSLQHLVSGSLFQASIAVANIILNGVIVDIFPTSVGAMAICTCIMFGRLGSVTANLVLGFLLDISCEIPLIIIVITLLVGTFLCFLIPSNQVENEKTQPKEVYNISVSDISIISRL